MSDPQQSPVPPYASNAPQPPQPGHQTAPPPSAAPTAQHYYQGGAAQAPRAPYAQSPYAAPAYAQPAYASTASGPTLSNAPGRIGFIIGLVGLGIGVLMNIAIRIMIRSDGYQLISLVNGALSVIVFLAAVAALVFGVIGLRRAGAPHGLAGIATGLGIVGVVNGGINFILYMLDAILYF